jgi:hypothetical protein
MAGFGNGRLEATPRTSEDLDKLLKTYTQVLSLAEENYADPVNTEELGDLFACRRCWIRTQFFRSEDSLTFRDDQRGNFSVWGSANITGQPTVI